MARFRSRIKSRIPSRGVTLVELCVVLALLLCQLVFTAYLIIHTRRRK